MLDQELQALWQQAPSDMQIKFNQSRLMIDLNQEIKDFNRKLKRRNLGEILAALFVSGIFTTILLHTSAITTQIGCIIIVAFGLFVIAKLLSVRRFKQTSKPNESFKAYIQQTHFYLLKERKLLENVLYWYISPFLIGYVFFGLEGPLKANHWGYWLFYGFYLGFGLAVCWGVWRFNLWAIKKEFNPLLEKIENLLETL